MLKIEQEYKDTVFNLQPLTQHTTNLIAVACLCIPDNNTFWVMIVLLKNNMILSRNMIEDFETELVSVPLAIIN